MTQPTQQQSAVQPRNARWQEFQAAMTTATSAASLELSKALATSTRGIDPEFWRTVVLNVVRQQPELITDCDPASFMASLRTCAQLGLMPDRHSGHAYFIPFNDAKRPPGMKTVQFIIGYKGLIELAQRTKGVRNVIARVVFAGDDFAYEYGLHENLRHVPGTERRQGREITHAYAICRMIEGDPIFTVVDRGEIDAIRRRSRASSNGPWVTDFAAMCAKTAVRQLARWMPMDNAIKRQLELDAERELDYEAPVDIPSEEVATHNFGAALAQRMTPRAPEPEDLPDAPAQIEHQAEPEPMPAQAAGEPSPIEQLFAGQKDPATEPEPRRRK